MRNDGEHSLAALFLQPIRLRAHHMPTEVARNANCIAVEGKGEREIERAVATLLESNPFAIEKLQMSGGSMERLAEKNEKGGGLIIPASLRPFPVVVGGGMKDIQHPGGVEHLTCFLAEEITEEGRAGFEGFRDLGGFLDQTTNVLRKIDSLWQDPVGLIEGERRIDPGGRAKGGFDFGLGSVPVDPGFNYDAARLFKPCRTAAWMSVESAEALEEKIDRGEVGDEQVRIDIDRLLDDLGGDKDASARAEVA